MSAMTQPELYPLEFNPILQQRIWGGSKLAQIKASKQNPNANNIGESWEISTIPKNLSIVANGNLKGKNLKTLIENYREELVGKSVYERFGNELPLLIKFIDAKQDLSIQLHPNDALAKKRHQSLGKTEMWYIMEAEKNARLIMGFKQKTNQKTYQQHLKNNKLAEILHQEEVSVGDTFFIDTGTVHAIGGGILLAEIQQSSDVTYRLYDWNRIDKNGNTRELHTELALEAINYDTTKNAKIQYNRAVNTVNTMVKHPCFTTNFISINNSIERNYQSIDSFVIYVCLSGKATVDSLGTSITIKKGTSILLPAIAEHTKISSNDAKLLEVYID